MPPVEAWPEELPLVEACPEDVPVDAWPDEDDSPELPPDEVAPDDVPEDAWPEDVPDDASPDRFPEEELLELTLPGVPASGSSEVPLVPLKQPLPTTKHARRLTIRSLDPIMDSSPLSAPETSQVDARSRNRPRVGSSCQ
ncbi:MAG: hypothetical protein AB2A00_28515 [Myxococcota bacterium]